MLKKGGVQKKKKKQDEKLAWRRTSPTNLTAISGRENHAVISRGLYFALSLHHLDRQRCNEGEREEKQHGLRNVIYLNDKGVEIQTARSLRSNVERIYASHHFAILLPSEVNPWPKS